MADVTWPLSLPQLIERPDYREKLPDITIRTQMDAGPDKVRLGSTTGYRMLEGAIICDPAQYATFVTFFKDSVKGGALPFDITWPRLGVIEVSFTEEPMAGNVTPTHKKVNFKLERMEPTA